MKSTSSYVQQKN